jgi:hypothetical protein
MMSSRFEKVARPSNREDIGYQDRGQLGLAIVPVFAVHSLVIVLYSLT